MEFLIGTLQRVFINMPFGRFQKEAILQLKKSIVNFFSIYNTVHLEERSPTLSTGDIKNRVKVELSFTFYYLPVSIAL